MATSNNYTAIAYVEENSVQIPEKSVLVLNYGGGYLEASFFPHSPGIDSRSLPNVTAKPCRLRLGPVKNLPRYSWTTLKTVLPKSVIEESPALLHEFRMQSERLKTNMRSVTAVPFSFMDVKPGTDFTGFFTTEDVKTCTKDLLNAVDNELKSFARVIRPHKVESIVLTGGSTRMPLFKDKLRGVFPHTALKETINAEEAAAIGAAIVVQHISPPSGDCSQTALAKSIATPDETGEAAATATASEAHGVLPTSGDSEVRTLAINVATPVDTGEAANTAKDIGAHQAPSP